MPPENKGDRGMARNKKVSIKKIVVGDRFRKKIGSVQDMEKLERSIATVGLIQPIVINSDCELLAGQRRLEACKTLGWKEIDCNIIDLDRLLVEQDENECRIPFTISERAAIAAALKTRLVEQRKAERKAQPEEGHGVTARQVEEAMASLETNGNAPPPPPIEDIEDGVKSRDLAAKRNGFNSQQTMTRAIEVIEKGAPELVELMDTKKVSITKAAEIAALGEEEQKQAVAEIKKAREKKHDPADAVAVVKDKLGHVVPSDLADVFADTTAQDTINWLEKAVAILKKEKPMVDLANKCQCLPWLSYGDIKQGVATSLQAVEGAISTLKEAMPYAICPACEGAAVVETKKDKVDCPECRGTGYMPEWRYKEYDAQLVRTA